MSLLHVELKKQVDDSYDIETGFELGPALIRDLQNGLAGNIKKIAVITDSIVKDLYAANLLSLLKQAGYEADLFVFEQGAQGGLNAWNDVSKKTLYMKHIWY